MDLGPAAAAANLRKALHAARRGLDADNGARLIVSSGDLLCPAPEGLVVDVDEYWAEVRAAREADGHRRAVERYGNGLLPEDRYEDR